MVAMLQSRGYLVVGVDEDDERAKFESGEGILKT
jgi:hypothetical protein